MKINDVILEKAPPGDKYERMVKHIKKGYAKDGKLTDVEKSKAYGAAWKAKNAAKNEATGDKMGQVTSVTPAGDVTIKTPTGTEIKTKKDALLPGAQAGTVQMKPDAADDALKPGTQVVSSEAMDDATKPDMDLSKFKPKTGTPAVPALPQGLQPGVNDLGDGVRVEVKKDGSIEHSSGSGTFFFDKSRKPVRYWTPAFNGLMQDHDLVTGNITLRYAAGPMDVAATYDKTGKVISKKAEYNLGLGKMGFGQEKGITTKSWTPASDAKGEDPITQKDMYAMGNKDKEATYDRAMKQVARENAELDAMLRIAGLK